MLSIMQIPSARLHVAQILRGRWFVKVAHELAVTRLPSSRELLPSFDARHVFC